MNPYAHILDRLLPLLFPLALAFLQWRRWRNARASGMTREQFSLADSDASEKLLRRAQSLRITAWLLIMLPIVGMATPLIRYRDSLLTLIAVTVVLQIVFGRWGWSLLQKASVIEERARKMRGTS